LSAILYVEQPVGTGFSQGVPNIQARRHAARTRCGLDTDETQDENGLAEQLVGFLSQFLDVFEELKGNKLYLTGESVRPFVPLAYLC
jgi:carboxypeptidase D